MISEIRWRQVIIAFLLGSVLTAGIVGLRFAAWNRPRDPKVRYERMLRRFSRTLKLTDEQKAKVGAIFEAQRQKIDALRNDVGPRFEELRRNATEEIRKLLTPEQQTKFDSMEKKHAEMRKRWRDDGFPPPRSDQ